MKFQPVRNFLAERWKNQNLLRKSYKKKKPRQTQVVFASLPLVYSQRILPQKNIFQKKKEKKKELNEKEKDTPFMQVDKSSAPISNFIANFKRQYREAKGLLDWDRLFGGERAEQPKPTSEPTCIIGATKTDRRSDFKNDEKKPDRTARQKAYFKNGTFNQNAASSSKKQETKAGIITGYLASERQTKTMKATLRSPI